MQCPDCGKHHLSWLDLMSHIMSHISGMDGGKDYCSYSRRTYLLANAPWATAWFCPWCLECLNTPSWNNACNAHMEQCTKYRLALLTGKTNWSFLEERQHAMP